MADPADSQCFQEALARVKLAQPLRVAVHQAMGFPESPEEYALIPQQVWEKATAGIQLPGGEGDDPPTRPLTPAEHGRLQAFKNALGATLPTVVADPRGVPAAPVGKKTKLSTLVDAAAEGDLVPVEPTRLRSLFLDYRAARGDFPAGDAEPSEDQIAAVDQLLKAGNPPYVDFSLFGPHGHRLQKRLCFEAFKLNAVGDWARQRLPGPADFDQWWRCWQVLKVTLLLLGAVSAERLEAYAEQVRHHGSTYGQQCWFLIYQADVRMRSEQFERIRRLLHIEYESAANSAGTVSGFDPVKPWDAVFAQAVRDREFWDREVSQPALMFLSGARTRFQLSTDGTAQYGHLAGDSSPSGTGKRKRESPSEASHANKATKGKGKRSTRNAKGKGKASAEVCKNFNAGRCDGPVCRHSRRHVCSRCGSTGHGAQSCRQGANGRVS